MIKYTVVWADTLEQLVDRVNRKIAQGYVAQGGMSFWCHPKTFARMYYQPMVRNL